MQNNALLPRSCSAPGLVGQFSGEESNELKAHKADPGQLAQFPATLRGLGRAVGHFQEVVWVDPPALGQEGLATASSQDQGMVQLLVYVQQYT